MNITHVDIVSLPVKDQQAAKAFYRDVLGFQVTQENPMGPDQTWVELGIPGGQTRFTLVTWFENMPPGAVQGMVLNTTDLEADFAALQAHGVAVTPLESAPWGKFTTFRDPDGNGWVLQQTPTN